MVVAFDTLSYARYLRERGIAQGQAEAHAEAVRQFVMADLVTKADLQMTKADLQSAIGQVDAKLDNAISHFDAKLDNLSLRLTVRLGVMLAAAVALLASVLKLA